MKLDPLYFRHRFPVETISYAVCLYYRFSLSFRDVEELMAQRGVAVTYETIRIWAEKFGRAYTKRLRSRAGSGVISGISMKYLFE